MVVTGEVGEVVRPVDGVKLDLLVDPVAVVLLVD